MKSVSRLVVGLLLLGCPSLAFANPVVPEHVVVAAPSHASASTSLAPTPIHAAPLASPTPAHVATAAPFHLPGGSTSRYSAAGEAARVAAREQAARPVVAPLPKVISLARAPYESHADPALLAIGRNLIHQQEQHVGTLVSTTGFGTLDEVAHAVTALGPQHAKAVELLAHEENFEFAMASKEYIRNSIVEKGFLNLHETKRSLGTDDSNPEMRANVESSFLGMSRAEYDKIPNDVRPKYGFLRPSESSGVVMSEWNLRQYGGDTFVFRPEAVREFVTVYPGDSAARSARGWPVRPEEVKPTEWHQTMQPWSDRMLLAPSLEVAGKTLQFTSQRPAALHDDSVHTNRYVEIQIWRPLRIEDVERFEFESGPPTGAFLKALRDNGVKIFKKNTKVEWQEDSKPATQPVRS